ncbi:helix-turn-helix domain-containing protein [Pseudomonas parafulva]|uniref:helix-turn-helix domain-containing protein n=1 Tax=Pseudomonas parafulva TaxID=157782 RepID=UPI000734A536|nr:helix-turn-helix transcriptional regulator [Pseudomonas parafulva]KTS94942.1 DNA-binding protein [Pseudomonas parafulva]
MKKLRPEQRAQLVEEIAQRNAAGLDSIGTSIRRLRLEVTGLDQETFATMCKMSTKSLYELESGKSNPKLGTVEAVLRLFGLRMGMVIGTKANLSRMAVSDNPKIKVGQSTAAATDWVTDPSSLNPVSADAGPKRGKSPAAVKRGR